MTTLNEHFQKLKFCRANKSPENTLRFVGETTAMLRLFEKKPGLLTDEVFGILEYHAKTGPKVQGLDTSKPRAKRFPTDTMCQAATELLGNIATNIPGAREKALATLENVIKNSTDYTARNTALAMLDTLLFVNGEPDKAAINAMIRQSKENDSPDIRYEACVSLRAASQDWRCKGDIEQAFNDVLQDPHPRPRNYVLNKILREARVATKIYEISPISIAFNALVERIGDPEKKSLLLPAQQEINSLKDNIRIRDARPLFEKKLECLKKLKHEIIMCPKFSLNQERLDALNINDVMVKGASSEELDILETVIMALKGDYDPKTNYTVPGLQANNAAFELEKIIFASAPNTEAAFERINRVMLDNWSSWRIQSGGLKVLYAWVTMHPLPPCVMETIEKCKKRRDPIVRVGQVNDLLKLHALCKAQKKPSAPGQG